MSKPVGPSVRVEVWTRGAGTAKPRVVTKVAVRYPDGKFHGATNFPVKTGKEAPRAV
jgi:hypothetical protein